jgi:hypothetical protein
MPVRFHPAARAELIGARDWYERAQSGLGDAFVSEIGRIVALVEEHPKRFPFHAEGVRRASPQFPQALEHAPLGRTHCWERATPVAHLFLRIDTA